MRVWRHLERLGRRFRNPVVTLGNFDGVHLGHQAIVRRTVERARELGGTALALTFEPHPVAVLMPAHAPARLMDLHTRVACLLELGLDYVVVQRFTPAFAEIEPEPFVRQWLIENLGVRGIVVGHRVRFGHFRRGDAALLQRVCAECGVAVEIIGKVEVCGRLVSSSAVRSALREGKLELAREMLGRPHTFAARVVRGHNRGKTLGFPTANLDIRGLVLPPDGVYAVEVCFDGEWRPAVANIGNNPTFGDQDRSLEVHVLDFAGDLYGRRLWVRFLRFLRGEIRFASVDLLVEQIKRDIADARRVFSAQA
ncbi:MAG: bifunctional riboflavin kinase/FAD synthetase [Candidatus Binatia bacterium]|nr:bifunctional riboflavin kinase/FAD synthetase [Candidatus Binatia bacterium]